MTGPRVTVAIVSYRHAPYLEQCIRSIVDQTEPAHIIVVDDHSPDDSQEVIRHVVADTGQPERFTLLLHQENIGLPAGLNAALRLTTTEYFVYLAGDDWSLPQRLQQQREALDAAGERAGLCYTDSLRARADGTFHEETFKQNHAHVWRPHSEDPFKDLLLVDNWIPAPTVMFRTAALRAVGGFDESSAYEDHDSYVRIARDYELVALPEALSVHRELDDCLGTRIFQAGHHEWIEGWLRMELKQLGARPDLDGLLAERIRVRAITLLKTRRNDRLAVDALRRAMRVRGWFDPAGWYYLAWGRLRMHFKREAP